MKFATGEQEGYGKFYFPEGHIYEGEVHNGEATGKGEVNCPDGTKSGGYLRYKNHFLAHMKLHTKMVNLFGNPRE